MLLTGLLHVLPHWLERQIDPAGPDFVPGSWAEPRNVTRRRATTIGVRARPERAAVDPRGLVTPDHAGWSLDWWVGAEDRWHVPSRERTVRQRLMRSAPVVETVVRVPGGEVAHRAYGFHSPQLGPCVGIEVENRSAVPVAVALAIRPYHPLGLSEVNEIAVEGGTVRVDGRVALVLPRPAGEARLGDGRSGDVAAPLLAGGRADGPAGSTGSVTDDAGRATAALVSPVPHAVILRAVVPLRAPAGVRRRGEVPWPDPVPAAEQVAKGWEPHVRQGLQVEIPDGRLQQAVDAALAHLLIAHGGEDVACWPPDPPPELSEVATVLAALDQWGFADEAASVLATWPERQAFDGAFASAGGRPDAAGAAVGAVAEHWRLTGDADLVESLIGPLAKAVHWIGKRRTARRGTRDPRAVGLFPESAPPPAGGPAGAYLRDAAVTARSLASLADALDASDQPGVADTARRLAADLHRDLDATIAAVVPDGAPVPATPSRRVDAGVVVNVDLFEPFGALPADAPPAPATLDEIRGVGGDGAAVAHLDGPAGLSPALTARLAAVEIGLGDARALDRLAWLVDTAGQTTTWPGAVHPRTGDGSWGLPHDPSVTAAFLLAVRRLLVHERADGSGLALCPLVPPAWLGQPVDVRRAPTTFGRFSFAVRWHGERPALLWELDPHDHLTDRSVTFTAPGLDPAWSATDLSGEALLGPVAVPSQGSFS